MPSDWEKVLAVAAPAGLIGLLIGIVTGIIKQRYGGWWGWTQGLASAVVVAMLVGLGIHDTGLSPTSQAAVIGLCAFIASDLLEGLLKLAALLRTDPMGFLARISEALRGRPK